MFKMNPNIFICYCPICKAKTLHRVLSISKMRGVKLFCCICSHTKKRYKNLRDLEVYEPKNKLLEKTPTVKFHSAKEAQKYSQEVKNGTN